MSEKKLPNKKNDRRETAQEFESEQLSEESLMMMALPKVGKVTVERETKGRNKKATEIDTTYEGTVGLIESEQLSDESLIMMACPEVGKRETKRRNKKATENDITYESTVVVESSNNDNLGSVSKTKLNKLKKISGLDDSDCNKLLQSTGWSVDDAIKNMEYGIMGTVGAIYSKEAILTGIRNAGIYEKLANNLCQLNPMRGGPNGAKGFVFEYLHAADATINGQTTTVLNNNSVADLLITSSKGKTSLAQAKVGYPNGGIDAAKYGNQTLVVDQGNKTLIQEAKKAGVKTLESNVTAEEAQNLAAQRQIEGTIAKRVTGKASSTVVPKIHEIKNVAVQSHNAGIQAAQKGAQFGAGFSLGTNLVDVISGDKEVKEAAKDVVVDTAIAGGVSYVTGAAVTAIGSTTAGAAAGTALAGIAGTATSAVASTAVGGAAIGAGAATVGAIGTAGTTAVGATVGAISTSLGAIGTAGTAVGGTVAAAGTAIGTAVAGTTVGGAAIAAGTAAGTAIAGTAVGGAAIAAGTAVTGAAVAAGTAATAATVAAGAAAAAAATAAAPVVAVAAVLGVGWKLGKKLFGK